MEGESHAANANAFNGAPSRRSGEDVIVLSSASARPLQSVEAVVLVDVEGEGEEQGKGQGQHMEMEAPPEKLYFKTRLCDKFEATGRCMYEDGCTFAHGRAELRPPVPPVGGFAVAGGRGRVVNGGGKVCFNFRDSGTCHFGDRCAFPHVAAAAPPGHAIRLTGDQKVLTEERRSATPPARTSPGPRYAAPGYARAYPYPPVLPPAARDDRLAQMTDENGGKKPNRLMLMSKRKIGGIYGDLLPEEEED